MKYFKNTTLIAILTLAMFFTSCSGITGANEAADDLLLEAEDMQDQRILEGGESMDVVRVRPD